MDKDIKKLLKENSKCNMPDLWDKIDKKIDDKKKRKNRIVINIVASIAIVFSVGYIGLEFSKSNNKIISNSIVKTNEEKVNKQVSVLSDIDLNKVLQDKIVINESQGNYNYYNLTEENYNNQSEVIVYGKVVNVKTYVKFDIKLYSDITVEVIKDYKNMLKESDTITICIRGGELTVEELINQLPEQYSINHGYNNIEDKSQKVIELNGGIPVYRVGEYVLIYANSVDNDNSEQANSINHDFDMLKGFYVNPNSEEIFEYKSDNNYKVIKEHIGNLYELKNGEE